MTKLNIRTMVEDHASREDFTYETIEWCDAPTQIHVFKHLATGKTYRVTLEEIPDPRKKPTHPRRRS